MAVPARWPPRPGGEKIIVSCGLDLEWLGAHPGQHAGYIASVQQLLARVLELPLVTVAAIQGHAFAAGAMLTLACDFRVMRADRGFWCLPEADIGLPFSAGMAALIQTRLSPAVAREAMITARRYGGQQALEAGIVDAAVAENAVRDAALTMAAGQAAKAGPVLAAIKSRMDADVTRALRATGE